MFPSGNPTNPPVILDVPIATEQVIVAGSSEESVSSFEYMIAGGLLFIAILLIISCTICYVARQRNRIINASQRKLQQTHQTQHVEFHLGNHHEAALEQ